MRRRNFLGLSGAAVLALLVPKRFRRARPEWAWVRLPDQSPLRCAADYRRCVDWVMCFDGEPVFHMLNCGDCGKERGRWITLFMKKKEIIPDQRRIAERLGKAMSRPEFRAAFERGDKTVFVGPSQVTKVLEAT